MHHMSSPNYHISNFTQDNYDHNSLHFSLPENFAPAGHSQQPMNFSNMMMMMSFEDSSLIDASTFSPSMRVEVEKFVADESRACNKETKRVRMENGHRIGFRMKSDVEILDDGFKWRKYGKKLVKNSPNPRNYYKCSSGGCSVKKRVERDPQDPCYVITTYDGVHNHICSGSIIWS